MISIDEVTATNDLNLIIEEIQAADWVAASEIIPDEYTLESLQAFIQQPQTVFVVAYLDQQFAGMASATIVARITGERWLYVDEVDVPGSMQRQGVGKALMKYLLEYARTEGCVEVWLGTEPDNAAANALYQSLSLHEQETFLGYTYRLV